MHNNLTRIANNLSLLIQRLRQAEWRQYAYTLIIGKAIALIIIFTIFALFSAFSGSPAYAGGPQNANVSSVINPINTGWTLLAAFLVFGMQIGFTMLEAGFCRCKETVNVLMECIVDTCLCGLLFWAVGFAFMFGHCNGLIGLGDEKGHTWLLLQNTPHTYEGTGVAFFAFWLFQFAFADTCSTITSGAMIGRTSFLGDLLYSVGVSGLIYPIIGHWAWGPDGFLYEMGKPGHFFPSLGVRFHDFAGSTVVHTIGGGVAFMGAYVLGPRAGKIFARKPSPDGVQMPPHNLAFAAVGGLILWFGWYGFNPGSTLSIMDFEGAGRVATNTTLAACAAGLSAMFVAKLSKTVQWDLSYTINGFLGGLVAITCPCYWVEPGGAVLIGLAAGVIVFFGVNIIEYLLVDDPIGAVTVHGLCGIWGTLSLGLFACGLYGLPSASGEDTTTEPLFRGLFYGGGWTVLVAQSVGSLLITSATLFFTWIMMSFLKILKEPYNLRVSRQGEISPGGIDDHEHGTAAYPKDAQCK